MTPTPNNAIPRTRGEAIDDGLRRGIAAYEAEVASGPVCAMVRVGGSYQLKRFDRKDWENRASACLAGSGREVERPKNRTGVAKSADS